MTTSSTATGTKHPLEAKSSWRNHLEQQKQQQHEEAQVGSADPHINDSNINNDQHHRQLKHKKKHHSQTSSSSSHPLDLVAIEQQREEDYLSKEQRQNQQTALRASSKHNKLMKHLLQSPSDINPTTTHGFMIDAGSTGSRIHLYEWTPRTLSSHHDVDDAVAGRKLSFPTSSSRWSDRLRPGLATFATILHENKNNNVTDTDTDAALVEAISDYLSPLLEFAKMILREKEDQFSTFPIFLRATAGMRTLDKEDRFRVLDAVRTVFNNKTYCPFQFEDEYARVISGEEEAVFGWAGTNFVTGNLLKESQGVGTVLNPKLTYGALDMGGASTQISFYEPHEDIMTGLFKLQIGQGKHWNLYAHSFLYFGMNEARDRMQAKLLAGTNATSRLVDGVYNPCLPGSSRQEVRLNIHYDDDTGRESWSDQSDDEASSLSTTANSKDEFYQAVLKNDNHRGDFDSCMETMKELLHLEDNAWCHFAHQNDCAFNGVYMPEMPRQSEHFGEFLAMSNYFHVWDFLGLPTRANLQELYDQTEYICNMNQDELIHFNKDNANVPRSDIDDYCFRSAYVFNVLHYGYGFEMTEYITATDVLKGQKVGWALGAMLYEINTFPWQYKDHSSVDSDPLTETLGDGGPVHRLESVFLLVVLTGIVAATIGMFVARSRRKNRELYTPIK